MELRKNKPNILILSLLALLAVFGIVQRTDQAFLEHREAESPLETFDYR